MPTTSSAEFTSTAEILDAALEAQEAGDDERADELFRLLDAECRDNYAEFRAEVCW